MTSVKIKIQDEILDYLKNNPNSSSMEIFENTNHTLGYATVKRILQKNVEEKNIEVTGKGKNTRYKISFQYQFIYPINVVDYFKKEF